MHAPLLLRLSLILALPLLLAACLSKVEEPPATPPEESAPYAVLVDESIDYLRARQSEIHEAFQLGTYERYDWDQENGQLVWSDNGTPRVIADIQFVGSISTRSDTWRWAWANDSILPPLTEAARSVQTYGKTHEFARLTTAQWPAEEADGWEMTAITAQLLQAKGGYRSPKEDGFTFLIFTDVRWAEGAGPTPTTP